MRSWWEFSRNSQETEILPQRCSFCEENMIICRDIRTFVRIFGSSRASLILVSCTIFFIFSSLDIFLNLAHQFSSPSIEITEDTPCIMYLLNSEILERFLFQSIQFQGINGVRWFAQWSQQSNVIDWLRGFRYNLPYSEIIFLEFISISRIRFSHLYFNLQELFHRFNFLFISPFFY